MPHLCTQPFFSSDLFPCESPQNSQLAAALLSPYATDPSLLASTERPGSSGGTGEDCFFLPEPVPLEYVGDLEPLPSYQANPAQLAQPARFSWDTADMQAMLASQFLDERPHVKREGQFEAVCSTSRSRQPGARSPQTDASSQAEKEDQPEKQEDRLESIRRTNREVSHLLLLSKSGCFMNMAACCCLRRIRVFKDCLPESAYMLPAKFSPIPKTSSTVSM